MLIILDRTDERAAPRQLAGGATPHVERTDGAVRQGQWVTGAATYERWARRPSSSRIKVAAFVGALLVSSLLWALILWAVVALMH
jgi:hypothetical protein